MTFIILNTRIYLNHLTTGRFFSLKLCVKSSKRNFSLSILGTILNLKKKKRNTQLHGHVAMHFYFYHLAHTNFQICL